MTRIEETGLELQDRKRLVESILKLFGSYRQVSKILSTPEQTVYAWVRKGNIPHWRRDEIFRAARKRRYKFTNKMEVYLKSKDKFPKHVEKQTSYTSEAMEIAL